MKRLAWQSVLLAAVLLLICVIARARADNLFTSYVYIGPGETDAGEYTVQPLVGNGDGDGSVRFEGIRREGDFLEIMMRPERPGEVSAELKGGDGEPLSLLAYSVNPDKTIYDYSTGGYTGDMVLTVVLTVFFLVESLLMYLAFRRAKGASFYAYSTIFTSGASIFLLLTGVLHLSLTVGHLRDPARYTMLRVYEQVSSSPFLFLRFSSPFILAFSAAMTISNIALLRHERKRLQNVLGILISTVMAAGVIAAFIIFFAPFSGSEREYRAFLTAQNVYSTIYVYFECMLIGAIICGVLAARHVPSGRCDYIVILGCGFRKDGSLPPLLRSRVDRAVSFRKEQEERYGTAPVLVPSGGQGPGEVMEEAEAMRRYLLSQGIPDEAILPEKKSSNTYQNMLLSKKLISRDAPGRGLVRRAGDPGEDGDVPRVVYSTTNYHVFRSGVWASLAGLRAEGIGSRTKWWFWPNAFVRELVGLFVNRWKQEILLLAFLIALFSLLSLTL